MSKNIDNLTRKQLEELTEIKRMELNKLFESQGLNDFTLRKSQELDVLIVKMQRFKLEGTVKTNTVTA